MPTLLHKDLVSITISSLLVEVGGGLVGIFLPLLLLNKGLAVWQICTFYVGYALCKLPLNFPITKSINKYGPRLGLVSAYSAMTVFMLLLALYLANGQIWYVWFMAVAMAIQNSYLWNSQHLHISRVMNESRKSRDLAMMANLGRIAGILTPVLGGIIAVALGQIWLVVIAMLIIALAIIPVWKMDSIAGGHKPLENLRFSIRQAPLRDVIGNFGFGVHASVGVLVWPIYLAVFLPHFSQIGVIATLATLISVIVLHFMAKRSDNGKTYRVLAEGTGGSSLVHMARIFAGTNPVTIGLLTAAYDVTLSYQANPWTSLYYSHTRRKGIGYITSMEIAGDLSYIFLWSLLGALAYFLHGTIIFSIVFAVAAIAVWLCLLITHKQQAHR